MQCREFEDRMQVLLDERRSLGDDVALGEHAGRCEACRDLAAALGEVLAELTAAAPPPTDVDRQRRLVAAVGNPFAAPASPRSAFQRAFGSSYAPWVAAACVLLAAYPVWRLASRPRDVAIDDVPASVGAAAGSESVAASSPSTTPSEAVSSSAAVEPKPAEPTFAELAQAARDSYAALADDVRRDLRGAWEAASPASSDDAPGREIETAETGWFDDVGDRLKQPADSTFGTLELFRSLVPADASARS